MQIAQRGSRIRSCTHSERFLPTAQNAPSSHRYQTGTTYGQPSGFTTAILISQS